MNIITPNKFLCTFSILFYLLIYFSKYKINFFNEQYISKSGLLISTKCEKLFFLFIFQFHFFFLNTKIYL